MREIEEKELNKLNIDDLTHLFMDVINEQNLKLIEGIEFLVEEKFENFERNLQLVIDSHEEVKKKKKLGIFLHLFQCVMVLGDNFFIHCNIG